MVHKPSNTRATAGGLSSVNCGCNNVTSMRPDTNPDVTGAAAPCLGLEAVPRPGARAQGQEQWQDIQGFEGVYQVSTRGRVKGLERIGGEGKKRRRVPERILKITQHVRDGVIEFCTVPLRDPKTGKPRAVAMARLVLSTFVSAPPSAAAVAKMRDGDPTNLAVENLHWGTVATPKKASRPRGVEGRKEVRELEAERRRRDLIGRLERQLRERLGSEVLVAYRGGGWYKAWDASGRVLFLEREGQVLQRERDLSN